MATQPDPQPNAQRADRCPEDDTCDSIIARRNLLAGLWAARLMRLPEHAMQAYAAEVHFTDYHASGDDDVVSKLCADLGKSGLVATRNMVRTRLVERPIAQRPTDHLRQAGEQP